jgi:hypothetical protein
MYHAMKTIRAVARHGVGRENANLSMNMGNLGSYRGTSSTEYDASYTDDGVSLERSRLPPEELEDEDVYRAGDGLISRRNEMITGVVDLPC